MKRPWHIWVLFALCLAVLLAAMGWVSVTALRLDRAERDARGQAELEESVRLALWRMDSALSPLIAQENARPYFAYTAFYPVERAYTAMFAKIGKGEVLTPSPLLTQVSPYILLHFQFGPAGELTSPQVPTGNMRDLAEMGYATHETILASERRLGQLKTLVSREALLAALPRGERRPAAPVPPHIAQLIGNKAIARQQGRSQAEWRARRQTISKLADQAPQQAQGIAVDLSKADEVFEGLLKPIWSGQALVLARRISIGGKDYVQGCWLDWPAIQKRLIAEARELLPAARLEPLKIGRPDGQTRMLAALPARLVPGAVALPSDGSFSPVRLSLIIAWVCVLLAAMAVAVLLHGAVVLSERRGAFVSAVTHEMRTPLTTFRMYTEMLDQGMVRDEDKRRYYLGTLRTEAERLSHLVENVLAYARLERGRTKGRTESVTVRDLLGQMKDRLVRRAEEADMKLVVEADDEVLDVCAQTDASAVEQVLLNLVDNACKYAASAEERLIHVEAGRTDGAVALRVRDHGPGVLREDAPHLFRPFRKSARDAASSAPGVGLGLALSRRLARSMGGDLRLDETVKDGACFVLTLPTPPSAS